MRQNIYKVSHHPITTVAMGIFLCIIILAVFQQLILKPALSVFEDHVTTDALRFLISIPLLLITYNCFSRYYEKRKSNELQLNPGWKELGGGLLLGFGCISASILILAALGNYTVVNIDFETYHPNLFCSLLLFALLEDLLIRGLALRVFEQWLGSIKGLAVIVVIEMLHLFNQNIDFNLPTVSSLLLWGCSLGIFFIYTKRIWLPYGFHVGWNFAQPFYGSNLTGLDDMGKIINARFEGSEILTGGAVGIEGSVITISLLLCLCTVFFVLVVKQNRIVKQNIVSNERNN